MSSEKITVEITENGATNAKPAIWYCEYAMNRFIVKKSKKYKGIYQVTEGEHKGMFIDSADCIIIDV